MGLTHEALGERLRAAREAAGLTQEEAASQLGVSRPTLAQIEAGRRKITGLELVRLSSLYGRTITDLLAENFAPAAEPVLMRALTEARSDPQVRAAVSEALSLVREILGLRELLGIHKTDPGLPIYRLPRLTGRWQAVELGNRLAAEERQRLGLGSTPVPNLGALLERQGALILEMELPDTVSGFTFRPNGEVVLAVHAGQAPLRRRFSLAHEYCHALCDWSSGEAIEAKDGKAIVCRTTEASELSEVRANAFAAAFLLPADGVSRFLGDLGKGSPTRPIETVFSEGQPEPYLTAEGRLPPHSQEIGRMEVSLLADYFGVSRECAVWRLYNLKLLGESQKDCLLAGARGEPGPTEWGEDLGAEGLLGTGSVSDSRGGRFRSARRMLLMLALEALRREEISAGKFRELAREAGVGDSEAQKLADEARAP